MLRLGTQRVTSRELIPQNCIGPQVDFPWTGADIRSVFPAGPCRIASRFGYPLGETAGAGLFFLRFPATPRLGKGEDNECFAGPGADVAVQAHHIDAGDLLNQRLIGAACRFDQMSPCLLEQDPPLLGRDFGQLLFGRRQQALEADDQKIVEQIGANLPGASAWAVENVAGW